MRKKLLVLALLAGTLSAQADEYPYLIFETTDGGRTPVEVESLTIQIVDGNLVAGGKTFSLASLSRMFFALRPMLLAALRICVRQRTALWRCIR